VGPPPMERGRELSRSNMKGRLHLRQHELARFTSTFQDTNQVCHVYSCSPGEAEIAHGVEATHPLSSLVQPGWRSETPCIRPPR
jgi:hypothetical protein